jgi:hypothetical protein
MRLLVVGVMAVVLSALLAVALLLGGYHVEQTQIPRFMGRGIAGKVDIIGGQPSQILIENLRSHVKTGASLAADGTFAARLSPGSYRLRMPSDSRSVTIAVPDDECLDVVLDFRIPGVLLRIPGEGWPIPQFAG